jgi:hypothetical protein
LHFRILLSAASFAAISLAADQGDGLKAALAAKPKINLSVSFDQDLLRSLTTEEVKIDAELILRQYHVPIADKHEGDGTLFISARATPWTLSKATRYAVLPAIEFIEQPRVRR